MNDTVIQINNLSKLYRLGLVSTGTISHDLNRFWAKIRGKEDPYLQVGETNDRSAKSNSDYVWALNDINLEIKRGDRVGIIGKNGAGKSTVLKILSKVTGPTTGQIKIKGRIGSLLEVGTGFNPELTGRENIYMNGTILGMKRWEVSKKLDEIVDFAGVERYLDTPVKRYSSGMKVRLGFAVAAHLEPDILIVDEVLAVGDAEFQKKAIGKMKDVSKGHGRTILFVSHNMTAIKSLCERAILLENGEKIFEGNSDDVIHKYLSNGIDFDVSGYNRRKDIVTSTNVDLLEASVHAENKSCNSAMRIDEKLLIHIKFKVKNPNNVYHTTLHFRSDRGVIIFVATGGMIKGVISEREYTNTCIIPPNFLNSISYSIDLLIVENHRRVVINKKDYLLFTLLDTEKEIGRYMGKEPGCIKPKFEWITN